MQLRNPQSRCIAIIAGLIVLAGCQPPAKAPDTVADKAAIAAAGSGWDNAYNAANADAIVALYADDAVLMPPGSPGFRGKAAMKEYFSADMAQAQAAGMSVAVESAEGAIGVAGDLGWRSGTFSVQDKSGATVDMGKWVEVWHREGGRWLIIRDIWNSDRPAAPSAD